MGGLATVAGREMAVGAAIVGALDRAMVDALIGGRVGACVGAGAAIEGALERACVGVAGTTVAG
jgi:hypothetical protein